MSEENTIRLNLGAGSSPIPGYRNIDLKDGDDIRQLGLQPESVDEIRASHVLEHIPNADVYPTVRSWVEALRPGGRLRIAVPDLDWIIGQYVRGNPDGYSLERFLYGGQIDPDDFHKAGFTFDKLHDIMQAAGLDEIGVFISDFNDCSSLPVSLNVEGFKPLADQRQLGKDIHAVMSQPRLTFSTNATCLITLVHQLGCNYTASSGAFWGQCLERVMQSVVEGTSPPKYLLTVDFDTIFTADDVKRLYRLAERDNLDAVCPVQIKRESDHPLISIIDENGKAKHVSETEAKADTLQVTSAHFGLTLLRVSSLLKLDHPWFMGIPDAEGRWGNPRTAPDGTVIHGRTDDDIYFWQKWSKAGNTVHQANRVKVGHLQQVITWPDKSWRARHQYINDYTATGLKPEYAR